MSERKVLNKYYPPDFDPTKIPRARQGKNKQFTVRLMAPCNMRCNTCGEYIYKGKKFNARKEDVESEDYLGLRIYRFYIKCTRCIADICFKTDPGSCDYIIEAGATRNFMALKLAEEQAEREEKAEKEDEATNPMKVLEKRTQASRHEMAVLEALEELKELNQRQITPDYGNLLQKYDSERESELKQQEEEDERFVQSIFGKNGAEENGEERPGLPIIKRIEDDDSSSASDEDDSSGIPKKKSALGIDLKPTDFLVDPQTMGQEKSSNSGSKEKEISIGSLGSGSGSLIKRKTPLVLVKPKTATVASNSNSTVSSAPSSSSSNTTSKSTTAAADPPSTGSSKTSTPVGLSLLGSYGSDSSDSD